MRVGYRTIAALARQLPPPVPTHTRPHSSSTASGPSTCVGGTPAATAISSTVRAPRARQRVVHPLVGIGQPVEWRGRTLLIGSEFARCGRSIRRRPRTRVTTSAPPRSSAWQPTDADDVTGPGTAHTVRPSARAQAAVLAAPLRSACLDDHGGAGERGDQPVAGQKAVPRRPLPWRILADHADPARVSAAAARHARPDRAHRRHLRAPRPSSRRPPAWRGARRRRCRTPHRRPPPTSRAARPAARSAATYSPYAVGGPCTDDRRGAVGDGIEACRPNRPQHQRLMSLRPQPVGNAAECAGTPTAAIRRRQR